MLNNEIIIAGIDCIDNEESEILLNALNTTPEIEEKAAEIVNKFGTLANNSITTDNFSLDVNDLICMVITDSLKRGFISGIRFTANQ